MFICHQHVYHVCMFIVTIRCTVLHTTLIILHRIPSRYIFNNMYLHCGHYLTELAVVRSYCISSSPLLQVSHICCIQLSFWSSKICQILVHRIRILFKLAHGSCSFVQLVYGTLQAVVQLCQMFQHLCNGIVEWNFPEFENCFEITYPVMVWVCNCNL